MGTYFPAPDMAAEPERIMPEPPGNTVQGEDKDQNCRQEQRHNNKHYEDGKTQGWR